MNLPPTGSRKTILLDLGAFGASLAATVILGWSTADLIWGLWISSLVSGAVFHLRGSIKVRGLNAVELALGSVAVLFGLAIFLVHFGMFHYIQGSILDLLIPLEPDPERVYLGTLTWRNVRDFSFFHSVWFALTSYWPFVATTVIHQFFSPAPNLKSENESFKPYYFVLKLHFLMFPLGALYELGLDSFPVYVLVLLVFFTPSSVKLIFPKKQAEEARPAG